MMEQFSHNLTLNRLQKLCSFLLLWVLTFSALIFQANSFRLHSNIIFRQNMTRVVGLWSHSPQNYYNFFTDSVLPNCNATRNRDKNETCHIHMQEAQEEFPIEERLRSISPYDHCIDHDTRRYPSHIVQAQCLCRDCLNYAHSGVVARGSLISKKVQISVQVVRFHDGIERIESCTDKTCSLDQINITVSCHCVAKKI